MRRAIGALAFVLAVASCGGGSAPTNTPPVVVPIISTMVIAAPARTLVVGESVPLTATARDQQGRQINATIAWSSSSTAIASVSPLGVVTAVGVGAATIQAISGSVSGSTVVSVAGPTVYVAGQSYVSSNGYIEYIAGNAPVILTAPHGGALLPTSIPDRTASACGGAATTVTDSNTQELIRAMQQRFFARFGTYPHVVISLLSRRKLDPNRLPTEAACNNAEALTALNDWHAFIDAAKASVLQRTGKGWYMDIHGHGHALPRLELGYLLANTDLDRLDAALDATTSFETTSSIATLSQLSPLPFSALLRGANSLGTLYADNGFPSIPSASDPGPNGTDYFNGGDNTARHSCAARASSLGGTSNGNICGVQVETHFTGVRDNAANRVRFGDATAVVLETFLRVHWGVALR